MYIANAGMDDPATYASRLVDPIDYSVYVIGTNGGLFGPQVTSTIYRIQ